MESHFWIRPWVNMEWASDWMSVRSTFKRLPGSPTLLAGITYRDIGNTTFTAPQAAPIRSNLGFGIGTRFDAGLVHITTSYDYTHALQAVDPRLRNHLGAEFKFTALSLYAGLNQVYLTYGMAFDVWAAKVSVVSYGQELGALAHQDPSRRYILRASFSLDF